MRSSVRLGIIVMILSLFMIGCEKAKLESAKAEALYQAKAQKVLATTSGGLHTIIMCKDKKVLIANHTGGSVNGKKFEFQELSGTICE